MRFFDKWLLFFLYLGTGIFCRQTEHVDKILLHDAHVGQLASFLHVAFLTLFFLFFALLAQHFLSAHGNKLDNLIRVHASARWTPPIEVRLDVVPTKPADLSRKKQQKRHEKHVKKCHDGDVMRFLPDSHKDKVESSGPRYPAPPCTEGSPYRRRPTLFKE